MKRRGRLPELLAPAGDFSALCAAIAAGADAVYVGGYKFGARAFAKNFSDEELAEAVKLCHAFGVRIYVTLNTLIFDKEMDEAISYARRIYEMGIDALIAADVGLICRLAEELPQLEIHASTQMGAHNTAGVDFAHSLGCKRAVIARECSLSDIRKITSESLCECEVFLHGALCVCHSGQCLFSSMVGGRSGNRGECAQPCRLPYNNGKYPLSLKDLSLSDHVRELVESGVSSLKIEGRMKSAAYVYKVTSIYRELLDKNRDSTADEKRSLEQIFSRGGFTDGYFTGRIFDKMTGVRTDDDKKISRELQDFLQPELKLAVSMNAKFKKDVESKLTITAKIKPRLNDKTGKGEEKQIIVDVYGDVAQEAKNAPLTCEGVKQRLCKMGNTYFSIKESDIEVEVDENINLSPSSINSLRRRACERLMESFGRSLSSLLGEEQSMRERVEKSSRTAQKLKNPLKTALFFSKSVYKELSKGERLSGIDIVFLPLFDYSEPKEALGIYLPPIVFEDEWENVRAQIRKCEDFGARYALVGNISHFAMLEGTSLIPICDFRINVTNRDTYDYYISHGAFAVILSPELTVPQVRDIGGGVLTLGRVPLMITERCFIKENFGCEKCNRAYLSDRKGARFPIMREYEHRNVIFNSAVTYMGDRRGELLSAGIRYEHFIFSTETANEALGLISDYENGRAISVQHRRIGKRNFN